MKLQPLILIAMMLSVGLAGCLSSGTQEGEPEAEPVAEQKKLQFLPYTVPECDDRVTYQNQCDAFGEPQLEVAGDGTIWYSSVCCVGQSPPIWLSHDGGLTWDLMELDATNNAAREGAGIEGDFAIDDEGNVYFFDITLATSYFTKFSADGEVIFTKPDAFVPAVDRPWVRAGAEDEVFIVYNRAGLSQFYRSDDGGLTWDLVGGTTFECGLAHLSQGAQRDHLLVGACGNAKLWQSHDGGITWDDGLSLGFPGSGGQGYVTAGATPDGTAWAAEARIVDDESDLFVAKISADGDVEEMQPLDEDLAVAYPWMVATSDNHVAIAFYGADRDELEWQLYLTYTTDGENWETVVADSGPLFEGELGRGLGDFLQLRVAENGDLVVAYGANMGGFESRFIRSTGIDFSPDVFRNGPQE